MIITNNEEALRQPCEDVSSDEVGNLISTLEAELENSNRLGKTGIGLAAPQIGLHKKVAIVRLGKGLNVNLVNAKIEKAYDQALFRSEGCLSFPGRVEDTMRYQEIYITNNLTYPHSFVATGLFAVVIQHELDHVNGILLPDRAITKPSINLKPYDLCHCNSGKKFKKCHGRPT